MDALLRCGTTDITVSIESPSKKRNTVGIFGKSEFFWVNGDVHCQEKMPYVSVILIFLIDCTLHSINRSFTFWGNTA